VFKYLKRALADYASDDDGATPVKNIELLLDRLNQAIEMTVAFCVKQSIDLDRIVTGSNVFHNLSLFADYANILVGNDEIRNEFKVLANMVDNLYESLRPDIFKMDFDPRYKDAILYLHGVVEGKIRPDKLEAAKERINALLDQSVMVAEDARAYIIKESGKEIDISKMDVDELREMFKRVRHKNLEIANLREHIEKKIEQMLHRNVTRSNFAERFRNIIDEYNSGGSQTDDFYEKILKFMEELRAEEERHIKEEMTEEELEIFDLLRKDKLTKDEEQRVKLAAKELYATLISRKDELFIIGWQNDAKPKERVRAAIRECLDAALPESYDRNIFEDKSNRVHQHIVDQAITGYLWIA
jgi:type I restriction enzyme R subunit